MTIGLLDYKHTRLKNMCVLRGYVEPNTNAGLCQWTRGQLTIRHFVVKGYYVLQEEHKVSILTLGSSA